MSAERERALDAARKLADAVEVSTLDASRRIAYCPICGDGWGIGFQVRHAPNCKVEAFRAADRFICPQVCNNRGWGVSGHTPGPWLAAAKPSSVVGWPVVAPAALGRSVCNVTAGHEEAEANARLIAAAPELLESCKQALEAVPDWTTGVNKELKQRMRAAIAKADGRP